MSKFMIFVLLLLNVIIFYKEIDSIYPALVVSILAGLYKGYNADAQQEIFNRYKIPFTLKQHTRKLELLCAFLLPLSTVILPYKQIFKGIYPDIFIWLFDLGYLIIFTFILYRFLFLNMFKNEDKKLERL